VVGRLLAKVAETLEKARVNFHVCVYITLQLLLCVH